MAPGAIPRPPGKAVRVVDRRASPGCQVLTSILFTDGMAGNV